MTTRAAVALLLLVLFAGRAGASPEIPGASQQKPIAIVGGTIHPVSGPDIVGGTLLFEEGRIVAVGSKVAVPDGAQRVDATGKHVYPSLLDAYTAVGLVEINAVRATRDQAESGQINPNVKAQVAVNPDSEMIPVTRSNGVLLALSAPAGGLISGTSAVMQLDGWTWEDMTLRAPIGMHLEWPRMTAVNFTGADMAQKERDKRRRMELQKIRQAFADARAYLKAKDARGVASPAPPPADVRWEAMISVLEGRVPLIVHAERARQIQAAVAFAQRQEVKLIIYGGYDAPHCAEFLKEHNVPVIVAGVLRLPRRRSDPYDAPFTVPQRLRAAGVKFCISGSGRFGASNVRNLPYHAATAAAYGLPNEEALRAITLHAAEILGVADRVGSLEVGKDATLIVTDGDPLETPTHVLDAFIQGRRVDLSDRHKRLNAKYKEKYRRLEAAKEN